MSNEDLSKVVDSLQREHKEFIRELKASQEKSDALQAEKLEKMNEGLSRIEDAKEVVLKAQAAVQAQRSVGEIADAVNSQNAEYKQAFRNFLKRGESRISAKDIEILSRPIQLDGSKALNSLTDPQGGYFVIPEMDKAITRLIHEASPIRQYARVVQTGSDQYEKMQNTDLAASSWADRLVSTTASANQSYQKLTIRVYKLEAMPSIHEDLIDDAYLDIEAELAQSIAESMSLAEGTSFVAGDGVGQCRGFLDYTAGTSWGQIEQVVSGSAATVTFNGLVDTQTALKDQLQANAKWYMRRATVGVVRKLLNGSGDPLWVPGLGAEPSSLLGHDVVRAADMPALGANALSIAYADLSKGYLIVDRVGTRILRDPFTSKGYVSYRTTRRLGGAVDNYEAIKIMKCST